MREIKFRAWHKTTNKMLQVGDDSGTTNPLDCCAYFVGRQPVILMQYTGLKDKNGKEIYEGDIIKNEKDNYPHKIIYTIGSFVGKQLRGKFKGYVDGLFFYRFEVIGNIYENPELLEN